MKNFVRGTLAALVVGSVGVAAQAADLPSYKAPPPPLPPVFTWTGLYGGVNIGYAFGASSSETGGLGYLSGVTPIGQTFGGPVAPLGSAWTTGQNLQGVVGGGQLGYNYQFNPWLVLGAEADIQAADIGSHGNAVVGIVDGLGPHVQSVNSTKKVDWFGTVRGRVGFTLPSMPNLMVYGTGGFAYGQVVHNAGFADNFLTQGISSVGHGYYDNTKVGWAAGGGLEWSPSMFPAWSLKAEYLYVDLGSTNANSVPLNALPGLAAGVPIFAATQSSPTRFHTVRAGLNWHFDPFAVAAPSSAGGALPSVKGPPPAFVDSYQPFQVRLKIGGVIPLNGHGTVYDSGAGHPLLGSIGVGTGLTGANGVIAGASTNTSSAIIPMIDVAYYLTKNWAIEAICCIAPAHIQGTGTIASDFARTWVFPPSIMAQYHFTNFGAFQPYVGVGVNFTTFWNTRVNNDTWSIPFAPGSPLAGAQGVLSTFQYATVAPSWGVVGQAGFDYMLNDHWGVNLDFKYVGLHPMVHSTVVSFAPAVPALGAIFIPVKVSLPINPIVISAGLTYRFGGSLLSPLF
ncbi:outer membrane beta-barrel protein [Methylocystis sp. H4A]|uniref:OmpW family outer membrane protein n=1 Tax=Methylocystis sp. H4A TaxID=2785788 RepID=UPI0018C2ED0E|nr:OmpW family outer membrane protein [Methylocystis sp. H4A]MBG0801462.1 outer membrane beta-barrel protein [Methylocystis sp. H4A]MBG0802040.1 outer membrane beta-barrel protein [Methylocystis sp. H4A]